MQNDCSLLVISNIALSPDASVNEAFSVAEKKLKALRVDLSKIEYRLFKKSIDVRKKDNIRIVYSVACIGDIRTLSTAELEKIGAVYHKSIAPSVNFGERELSSSPIIVGAGPCGLFCALMLAENGYRPIIIERGGTVRERTAAIDLLYTKRVLDTSSNIQFGLGGAGTFSDGKLVTRTNDPLCSFVMSRLVDFGAPAEILYQARPHIGTDILRAMVTTMADRICELGGQIRYNTRFIGVNSSNGFVKSILTDKGEIEAGAVVLALGHSARDTYESLLDGGLSIEAKNFSVGMRIEHLCEDIDSAMFGKYAGCEALGHAEYNLSCNTKVRGAYTFCMCPGGEVVCASSENGGVVVNGMSYSKRDGKNSNSAVVVSVFKDDFGNDPRSAIDFQRGIERRAFSAAGGDYSAPVITVGDFMNGTLRTEPSRILPTYMNGGVRLARPDTYLPSFVTEGIRGAIIDFNKKIKGFSAPDAVLTGAETRTSAPVRILRNQQTMLALGYSNLYPAGEGAGYAGGITSASVDGIKCALSLMSSFKPLA